MKPQRPVIGVALSVGSAASMAQVGVLQELELSGIRPAIVAGSSGGAMVGAACAGGRLKDLQDAMCSLDRRSVLRLFDPLWPRQGLLEGRRSLEFVRHALGERIEQLPNTFAAVATDLDSGREVVLREGEVIEAVRASIAIPGIFTPLKWRGSYLVDGGLANPIPVSVARDLGAQFVIGVSTLNLDLTHLLPGREEEREKGLFEQLPRPIRFGDQAREGPTIEAEPEDSSVVERKEPSEEPGLIDVVLSATRVVEARIAAGRLREDPADFLIQVPVRDAGLFDFHRSRELIEVGRETGRKIVGDLREALDEPHSFRERLARWVDAAALRTKIGLE